MGIYDRDYYREDWRPGDREPRRRRAGIFSAFSAVAILIGLNVAIFIANGFFFQNNEITNYMFMTGSTLSHPLEWYRILTYGFAHSPDSIQHVLFNMLTLFFFGPPVERIYGKKEFFLIYLITVVLGGLIWGLCNLYSDQPAGMLGASGAISAIVILFALNYPHAQVLLMGFIPMPAWLLGILYILLDTMGMLGASVTGGNIAHSVHLTGAALALVYFFSRWRFASVFRIPRFVTNMFKPNPKKQYRVWPQDEPAPKNRMEEEVDRLLRKISQQGESSLTDRERETLREASRKYQEKTQNKD